MSFRIHAAGSDGYRYTRDNNPDEDIFEAASVISALNASGPSVGGAVEGVADYVSPSVSVTDGARSVASATFIHMLRDSVDMLATCGGASQGWISVSPRLTHTLWPDTSDFARYEFYPGDSPGSEFIRMILPALGTTDFNHYGTFRALSIVLSDYYHHLNGNGTPTILIHLSQ